MRALLVVLLSVALPGCYLSHVTGGQLDLASRRVPITDLLSDSATDEKLRRQLALVQQARAFSVVHLHLPDNQSYRQYADLGRPYVVWNIFAATEFSLDPKTSCFLFVGCLAYRGYFEEELAQRISRDIAAEGYEVYVGGVTAYSTLGWFADPVLSTMLRWDDDPLLETLFHELAHQQLYVGSDTAFNESFATFVGEEGLRQFRAQRFEAPPDRLHGQRARQFQTLVLDTRSRLETLYASASTPDAMRAAKQAEFDRLRADYRRLRATWSGYAGYDGWFAGELNNAKLLPVGLYHQWVPAFAALFREAGGDWRRFYQTAKTLADLGPQARRQRLESLAASLTRAARRPLPEGEAKN